MVDKQLLIVKTGSTLSSLLPRYGDFDDWVISGLSTARDMVDIVDVSRGQPLPPCGSIAGVVITGSHDMVTARSDWMERTGKWLPQAVDMEIPILGICFGHQLLAWSMGGTVGLNPTGRECGTVDITLKTSADRDPLFAGFGNSIRAQVSHTQSVLSLPRGATTLASGLRDPIQAFVIGKCAWGVQFHPEFGMEVVKEYINYHREALISEGQDLAELIASVEDTPAGTELLTRFGGLVTQQI
jgi:GMP synthase (glutamine-hydrolysing)